MSDRNIFGLPSGYKPRQPIGTHLGEAQFLGPGLTCAGCGVFRGQYHGLQCPVFDKGRSNVETIEKTKELVA